MDKINVGDEVEVTFRGKVTAKKTGGVRTFSVRREGSETVSYFEEDEFDHLKVTVLRQHFDPKAGELYRVKLHGVGTGGLWFVTRQGGRTMMASRSEVCTLELFRGTYIEGSTGFTVEKIEVP